MGAGTTAAVLCCLCCFLFAPFVLQAVGLFTPKWGSNSTCASIGLVYSCCSGDDNATCQNTGGGDELDVRALGLQATSFAIMFLAVAGLCCGTCNSNDDDGAGLCSALGGCCFLLFPVAGLFSIIGCIIVATKITTSNLGYSFILCLTSGCFVLLVTIVGCCLLCKAMKDDDDTPPSTAGHNVAHTSESGAVYPYSGENRVVAPSYGGGYVAQHASVEQAVAVHDHESGSIMVFMRKINITRIVGQSFRHSDD